jgi:hypothetical protein
VDDGFGEIFEPARMIEIEMGKDDVTDVPGAEAQCLDLPYRGFLLAQLDVEHRAHRPGNARMRTAMSVRDIAKPVAGIDQHEAVAVGLDQQAMADEAPGQPFAAPVEQRPADRAIGAAIEVMDAHDRLSEKAGPSRLRAKPGLRRPVPVAAAMLIWISEKI